MPVYVDNFPGEWVAYSAEESGFHRNLLCAPCVKKEREE